MSTIEDVRKEFDSMLALDMWVPKEARTYLETNPSVVNDLLLTMSVSDVADTVVQLACTMRPNRQ